MKKYIFLFIILIAVVFFNTKSLYTQNKINFGLEPIGTDYNGVITNGYITLAYGKYGIITYSTDGGDSWKQISLGAKLDILKIVEIQGIFYALTPYSILKSTDNGLNWTQRELFDVPELVDFTFDEQFFYLATKNKIFRIGIDLTNQPEPYFDFDEFTSFSEIAYLNNYLFGIESKYYIFRINLKDKKIDTIDFHESVLGKSSMCRDISHLKVYDSTIYILAENIYQNDKQIADPRFADMNITHCLLKSKDYGENWKVVTSGVRLTKEYQIVNDTLYFLTHKAIKFNVDDYFYSIGYFKYNPVDKNEEEINPNDTLEYMIPIYLGSPVDISVPNTFKVNSFTYLNRYTIIAVGPNKTILRSTNGGRKWDLISYFKPLNTLSISNQNVKFLGNDTIIILPELNHIFSFHSMEVVLFYLQN